jgi:hypothetical protein
MLDAISSPPFLAVVRESREIRGTKGVDVQLDIRGER